MKWGLSIAAVAWAILSSPGQGHAQQFGYPPYTGYSQPAVYAPQTEGTRPSLAAYLAGQQAPKPIPTEDFAADCGGETEGDCSDCGCDPCCCDPGWRFFGEFLYLRSRNTEVVYAVPIDGAIVPPDPDVPPIQVGPTAIVDFDYDPGLRVGVSRRLGDCGRIQGAYTFFETATSNAVSILPPNVLHSMVSHPGTDSASQRFLSARAAYSLDFRLADVDLYRILSCGDRHQLSGLMGARYAGLQQDFTGVFTINNAETVNTDIAFDGGGIRLGLDAEFYGPCRTWMAYTRGTASFVGGEFRASYAQDDMLGQRVVYTDWRAGRLVSMLDLEVGIGCISPCDRCRLSAGYMVSGWFNTVKTDEWIRAVRANEFGGLGDTITFDGFVARAELRF